MNFIGYAIYCHHTHTVLATGQNPTAKLYRTKGSAQGVITGRMNTWERYFKRNPHYHEPQLEVVEVGIIPQVYEIEATERHG